MATQKNKIALVTSWGENFGTGHLYRMATLLDYLLAEHDIETCLVADPAPSFLEQKLLPRIVQSVPQDSTLIIRDMRDSSVEEIELLKQLAPVLVIDDCGEGRSSADAAIDLLPNLKYPASIKPFGEMPFLFGYNFYAAVRSLLTGDRLQKRFDFCFYAGANPSLDYISFVLQLIPSAASSIVIDAEKTMVYKNGKFSESDMQYPWPLLCSENLISHFGVTIFEGALCGCNIFTINPTSYHSQLSDIAPVKLNNFGVY
jgi:hypothetical protein